MKKITLISMLAFSAFSATAQNFYTFSTQQQTYADLQNPVSINGGEVWDYDEFDAVAVPFPFKVMGETVDRFMFADDGFVLLATGVQYQDDDEGIFYLNPSNLYIQDRTADTEESSSPISYKLEGTTGNRILKLEVKNASIEDATTYGYADDYFYMSFQIWLYEANQTIEFHYGSDNISDLDNITDGDGLIAGFGDEYNTVGFVYGNITAPSYSEFTEETIPGELTLSDYPTNGTVYRFASTSVAGIPTVKNNIVSLYPNPASGIINIKSAIAPVSHCVIFDTTGKIVAEKNTAAATDISINIENLANGIYFIDVNGQHLKFVKN